MFTILVCGVDFSRKRCNAFVNQFIKNSQFALKLLSTNLIGILFFPARNILSFFSYN